MIAMNHTQHTYRVENPIAIKSVVLSDVDVSVEVLSSGDGSMYATYFTSDREKYDIEVEDGTLYIKKRVRILAGFLAFLDALKGVKLTMYLPDEYAGELRVTTVDGDITVRGVTVSSLAVKTTDGDITVSRMHIDGSLECKTLDGDIAVGGITAAEALLKTTDGDITLDRPIISDRLSCRAADGDITGVLAGRMSDYTFSVRTGDGDTNVASGGTGKTLAEIKTADGDVALSFSDEG